MSHSSNVVSNTSRLAAVQATELLDSPPEEAFDVLTRMASQLLHAPFAFITIVDDVRSFWKSAYGLPKDSPRQNTVEESFCQYVIQSGKKVIIDDAASDAVSKNNPSIAAMGVHAWAGFPINAPGGEVLGSFCVVDQQVRHWNQREIDVLALLTQAASREIALRSAVASERLEKERAFALIQTLQESLLPPAVPQMESLDIGARFVAAGTGVELVGDFYEVFVSKDHSLSFVLGDVCGKGIEAAKLATFSRHVVSAAVITGASPKHVLERLNTTVLSQQHVYRHRFLTAAFGTIRPHKYYHVMTFANAGQMPPIVLRADGSISMVEATGDLVGVWSTFHTNEIDVSLFPGDTVVIFTDGVNEARNERALFGEERLFDLIDSLDTGAGAQKIADTITDAVVRFSGGQLKDDVAVLAIRVPIPA